MQRHEVPRELLLCYPDLNPLVDWVQLVHEEWKLREGEGDLRVALPCRAKRRGCCAGRFAGSTSEGFERAGV